MITASEILDAVRSDGTEKWRPLCERKTKELCETKAQLRTIHKSALVYNEMGTVCWTVKTLTAHLNSNTSDCQR